MQNFSARETEWLLELDGIELAGIHRRAWAFLIDVILSYVSVMLLGGVKGFIIWIFHLIFRYQMPRHAFSMDLPKSEHALLPDTLIMVFYFGLFTWLGKGRSPGKRFMGIRVVSLMHRHLSLWHAIERALGYGAALLEGGFGFIQYFIHPYRRTVQDRIAETIVVTERGYQMMQRKLSHPLLPDDGHTPPARLADEVPKPEPPPLLRPLNEQQIRDNK